MPPETKSEQTVARGAASAEEQALFSQAYEQSGVAGQAARQALFDPQTQLAQFGANRQRILDRITSLEARNQALYSMQPGQDIPDAGRLMYLLPEQIAQEKANLAAFDATKPILEKQGARYAEQEEQNRAVQTRLMDFISGKDIGVSPEERALITQGISGISQDVATSRGLNRSDVPVMQAVAPSVSQALLAQANANRSLFTGINQFQQGLDLSNRQTQAGLAGQNPAANLTGVYSGLRSSNITGSTQQGYGALSFVDPAAQSF